MENWNVFLCWCWLSKAHHTRGRRLFTATHSTALCFHCSQKNGAINWIAAWWKLFFHFGLKSSSRFRIDMRWKILCLHKFSSKFHSVVFLYCYNHNDEKSISSLCPFSVCFVRFLGIFIPQSESLSFHSFHSVFRMLGNIKALSFVKIIVIIFFSNLLSHIIVQNIYFSSCYVCSETFVPVLV